MKLNKLALILILTSCTPAMSSKLSKVADAASYVCDGLKDVKELEEPLTEINAAIDSGDYVLALALAKATFVEMGGKLSDVDEKRLGSVITLLESLTEYEEVQ